MIVYSTIYGGYDRPKPPRPHPRVTDWVLYTDDPELYAPGWSVVVEPHPELGHPRMRAKFRKCHPPRSDDGRTLYLDASIRLHDPALLEHTLEVLERSDWACYPHPERVTLKSEVDASRGMAKYAGLGDKMLEQVEHYENLGVDIASLGLWAGGILARYQSVAVRAAGAAWFEECVRWTYQDQLSLPVVLARRGIIPTPLTLGGGLWNNPHFTVELQPERA